MTLQAHEHLSALQRAEEALQTAYDHLDMEQLHISHCKDAALIEAAIRSLSSKQQDKTAVDQIEVKTSETRANPSVGLLTELKRFDLVSNECGYNCSARMEESSNGDYVLFEDVAVHLAGSACVPSSCGAVRVPSKYVTAFAIEDGRFEALGMDLGDPPDGTYQVVTAPVLFARATTGPMLQTAPLSLTDDQMVRIAGKCRDKLIDGMSTSNLLFIVEAIEEALKTATDSMLRSSVLDDSACQRPDEKALRSAGGKLANMAFNFAQKCGETLTSDDCSAFDQCRKEWDAALSVSAVLPAVTQAPAWISVEERLPEPETDVLVRCLRYSNHEYFTVAGMFEGEWASMESESDTRGEVTHWMPLPTPPIAAAPTTAPAQPTDNTAKQEKQ